MNELASGRLLNLVERLLALQPAIERYRELENLAVGLMMTAEVSEIEVPGKGWVTLSEPGRLTVMPAEHAAGALIEIVPLKELL